MVLLKEDMVPCPNAEGVAAVGVLELFERLTGELFSDTPGALVGSRVRGMAKVLDNISREENLDPPLLRASHRAYVFWNRRPLVPADVSAWRRIVEQAEAHSAPVPGCGDRWKRLMLAWLPGFGCFRTRCLQP